MTAPTYQQCRLRSEYGDTEMMCWLNTGEWKIEAGSLISLEKVPDVRWVVQHIYSTRTNKNDLGFVRGWKVGGLA